MPRLGVNIDHVATVRQARHTNEPDPVWAAASRNWGVPTPSRFIFERTGGTFRTETREF